MLEIRIDPSDSCALQYASLIPRIASPTLQIALPNHIKQVVPDSAKLPRFAHKGQSCPK